jgi:hypothetical protein
MSSISQQNPKKYNCAKCNIETSNKKDYNNHLLTNKHKIRTSSNNTERKIPKIPKNPTFVCKICNKEYKARNSLWYHEQKCNQNDYKNESEVVSDSSNNEIIQVLIKENSDFKSIIMEMLKSNNDLVKNNTDLQKQMLDVCQKFQPSTINNNINNNTDNSNKTFNLQVFLNEKCKDAMNLDDFANSIQLKLSDLIRVGEEGYVPGMSKVIIEWLGGLKVCDRPIHCTDEKREAIQVKIADKWEKEAINSEKLMNAVRIVEKKQFDMITTFRDTYPECMNSESHHNDMLIKLFQNLSNSREPEFIKVMKKVAKSVVIDKENN